MQSNLHVCTPPSIAGFLVKIETTLSREFNRKHTMDVQRELESLKPIIRCLIMSHPRHCLSVTELERDFRNTEGYRIPFSRLGFPSVYHLLCSIKDTVHVYSENGIAKVRHVSTPAVAHVEKLLQNTPTPRGKRQMNVRFKENIRQHVSGNIFRYKEPEKPEYERFILNDLKKMLPKPSGVVQPTNPKVDIPNPWWIKNNNGANIESKIRPPEKAVTTALITKEVPSTPAAPTAREELTKPAAFAPETAHTKHLPPAVEKVPIAQVVPKEVPSKPAAPTAREELTKPAAIPPETVHTTQLAPAVEKVPIAQVVPTVQKVPTAEELPDPLTTEDTCEHVYGKSSSLSKYTTMLDWLNMLDLPSEVMGLSHTIPKVDLRTYFAEREITNVRVMHMLNPNRLWLRCVAQETIVAKLYDELNECYNTMPTNRWCLDTGKIQHGLYCAVLYSQIWERARIVGPLTGNHVKVHLIDTGTTELVDYRMLRYLSTTFSTVPAQAIRASLACLIPKGKAWTRTESDRLTKFIDFVSEQPAYVLNINHKNKVLHIILKRKNGDWLNERFATVTSAQWTGKHYLSKHPDEFRKKRPTYNEKFPSFFCIEDGHFPVMEELRRSLERGFDYEDHYTRIPHTVKGGIVDQTARVAGEKMLEIFNFKPVSEEERQQIMQGGAKILPEND